MQPVDEKRKAAASTPLHPNHTRHLAPEPEPSAPNTQLSMDVTKPIQMRSEPLRPPKISMPALNHLPPAASSGSLSARQEQLESLVDGNDWARRPPPENIYGELDNFFPKHDVDNPVIDATSDDAGLANADFAEPLPLIEPIYKYGERNRTKKSIRVAAQQQKSNEKDILSQDDSMMRVQSTKLCGSQLKEVTTLERGKNSAVSRIFVTNDNPIFEWIRGELIGKGHCGDMYFAFNLTASELLAVKQIEFPHDTTTNRKVSRRITVLQALEARSETLKNLSHRHIVQFLGLGSDAELNINIFLEYVPGGSIGSYIRQYGKLPDNGTITRSFAAQILSGLAYLHSKGVAHQDLKADNILLEKSGLCKISGFALYELEDLINFPNTLSMESIFWMSPEVIVANKIRNKFKYDIWGFGCIALEMWTGLRPWISEEIETIMFQLFQSKKAPPMSEDVVLSEEAEDFRKKCFTINPEERPSAAELQEHPYVILSPSC